LDLTGLLDDIIEAATAIDYGRKGFAIRGKAEEGRISYETGISLALTTFKDAQSTIDPHTIILVEYTFLNQEFQFCEKTDTDSINSLSQAIQSFDDAFLVLKIVEDSNLYKTVDQSFPHYEKYREKGFPKDSYHIACKAHRTRLKNILRSPGIDLIEKTLLKQRFANLSTAQKGYIAKQKNVLG
jgi:hypothetical protein